MTGPPGQPNRPTWDEKAGRAIRRFFQMFMGPAAPRGKDPLEDWERAKSEAWDREQKEARDVLRDRRARRREREGHAGESQ